MKTGVRKAVAGMLVVTMTSSVVPPAWAGTIDTESALTSDRERILVVLDRPDVQTALEARGVSAEDAKARIAALTDAEVAELGAQIDSAPSGAKNPLAILALPVVVVVGAAYLVGLLLGGIVSLAVNGVRGEKHADAVQKRTDQSTTLEEKRATRRALLEERRAARAAKRAARAASKRSTQAAYPSVMKAESR
jgi:hypothetical protein